MKQKMVVRVSMKRGSKPRSKALKIAASVSGNVEKISLEGDDKDKIELIGDVDPIELTELLRKGFGCAQLESVSEVKEEDEDEDKDKDEDDKDKDKDKDKCEVPWIYGWGVPHQPSYYYCYPYPY